MRRFATVARVSGRSPNFQRLCHNGNVAPSYCNTPKVTVVNQLIEVQSASTSDHRQWCVGSGDEQCGRSIVARLVQVHRRPVYVSRTHSLSPPGARGRILTQLLGLLPPFACALPPRHRPTGHSGQKVQCCRLGAGRVVAQFNPCGRTVQSSLPPHGFECRLTFPPPIHQAMWMMVGRR